MCAIAEFCELGFLLLLYTVYCTSQSVDATYSGTVVPTPWGMGVTCCPHFYKWLGTGGTVSRKTANKKLTKLY